MTVHVGLYDAVTSGTVDARFLRKDFGSAPRAAVYSRFVKVVMYIKPGIPFRCIPRSAYLRDLFLLGLLVTSLSTSLVGQSADGYASSQAAAGTVLNGMPADAIITLLQHQAQLLQATRIRMAQVLGVDPGTITDAALFDRIRQDQNLRSLITQELQKRGYDTTGAGLPTGYATQIESQPQYTNQAVQPQTGNQGQSTAQNMNCAPLGGQQAPFGMGSTQPSSAQQTNTSFACPPGNASQTGLPPQVEIPQPLTRQRPIPYANLPSLQDLYTQMVPSDATLKRFGSDVFLLGTGNPDSLPMDLPAGPDYVLGAGDVLTINIWGSQTLMLNQLIDRQGQITLPEAGSVALGGLTITQAQEVVRKALQTQFKNVHAEISLGRVHTVRVYVVGDVQRPGAYDVSSLSTPLNALYAAGGPTSRGSLRLMKQYRGQKLVQTIDLYDFLLLGMHSEVERLLPGDTLIVPPVGPQVTVTGMVRRPAIYELNGGENLKQALELAGGVMVSASLQQINLERIDAYQRRTMLSVSISDSFDMASQGQPADSGQAPLKVSLNEPGTGNAPNPGAKVIAASIGKFTGLPEDQQAMLKLAAFPAKDGDRIVVLSILPYNEQTVYLDGHVFRPGRYPYHEGMTISDLVRSYQDVMPEPSDHVELIRLQAPDYRPRTIELNLPEVLHGNEPTLLKPFDVVRVFSRYEVDAPMVRINGEVLRPGDYPLSNGMKISSLINMAGGFRRSADREIADLATYAVQDAKKVSIQHAVVSLGGALRGTQESDMTLKPGDVLSVRQMTGWKDIGSSVTLDGEVDHPGIYGITEGERLSEVIKRSGGLRASAYVEGAVLERVQVRQLGEQARIDLIQRIQSEDLTSAVASGSTPQEQASLLQTMRQQQQQALSALRDQPASGRLVINLSSDVSRWENTQADVELRNGDVLTIPKKAAFVVVNGQVYNPSALSFISGRTAGWYLNRAGGATKLANRKDIFIVRANGSVVGRRGMFGGSVLSSHMRPGDSIVVPEKIVGPPLWKSLLEIAQVMSTTTITAALAAKL